MHAVNLINELSRFPSHTFRPEEWHGLLGASKKQTKISKCMSFSATASGPSLVSGFFCQNNGCVLFESLPLTTSY